MSIGDRLQDDLFRDDDEGAVRPLEGQELALVIERVDHPLGGRDEHIDQFLALAGIEPDGDLFRLVLLDAIGFEQGSASSDRNAALRAPKRTGPGDRRMRSLAKW